MLAPAAPAKPKGVKKKSPVVTTTAAPLTYTAGDPATAVDPNLTVTDPDDTVLQGATVGFSAGFEPGDDLLFATQNGIVGMFNSGTGVLTLAGPATVADYQAALRSVEYHHTGPVSFASKTVEFVADDGKYQSAPATRDINVVTGNQAPVVTTSPTTLIYTEGDPGTAVDPGLTVTDADDTNLEGATVRFSAGFEPGDDLVFVNQLGISGVYNTGTGVLTLTGTATVANYQAALRSVQYRHTGSVSTPSKTVEFTANDGDVDSAPATRNILVVP